MSLLTPKWIEANDDGYIRIHQVATKYTGQKYVPMRGRRVFCQNGLAAMMWLGDKGAYAISETWVHIPRKDYASVSIISRGSFQMTTYPEASEPWPLCTAGTICSDVCPDFIPGLYHFESMEDASVELCLGGVNTYGHLDYGRFTYKKVLPGPFKVERGSVLVVATGGVRTEKLGLQQSPAFIAAETLDIDVILEGEGMWIARI